MTTTIGNTPVAVDVRCRVCGRSGEFDAVVARLLSERPELLADSNTDLVFVCGECTAAGRCPCCSDQSPEGGGTDSTSRPR